MHTGVFELPLGAVVEVGVIFGSLALRAFSLLPQVDAVMEIETSGD
jgi:hypothetical protein